MANILLRMPGLLTTHEKTCFFYTTNLNCITYLPRLLRRRAAAAATLNRHCNGGDDVAWRGAGARRCGMGIIFSRILDGRLAAEQDGHGARATTLAAPLRFAAALACWRWRSSARASLSLNHLSKYNNNARQAASSSLISLSSRAKKAAAS